ncbi:MAG TPA: S8 family serine peptidase [Vicinamibacterales bacterium]|nr:S8 family serine peptidase [Vicinamibacterales bacterium]
MRVERDWLRKLVFEMPDPNKRDKRDDKTKRFTQDSPILPEVWLSGGVEYCRNPDVRVDLLLTPHRDQTAGLLARAILDGLDAAFTTIERPAIGGGARPLNKYDDSPLTKPTWTVSVNQTSVAASLTFKELVTCVLPLSPWWKRNLLDPVLCPDKEETKRDKQQREDELAWMERLVGVIALCAQRPTRARAIRAAEDDDPWVATQPANRNSGATVADYREFCAIVDDDQAQSALFRQWVAEAREWHAQSVKKRGTPMVATPLWSIALNRQSLIAIRRSVPATKSDAARLLFDIKCNELAWAVVDSGIDARHPAFRMGSNTGQTPGAPGGQTPAANAAPTSRVKATYDFTRLRQLLSLDSHPTTGPATPIANVDLEESDRRFKDMRRRLRSGQSLDWATLEPMIELPMTDLSDTGGYRPPIHDHGTHVAGIIGASDDAEKYYGVCRDIGLYDFRVLDDNGRGEEFSIIAALQFIRYLNARADQPIIHGVNLSLSLLHDVENFACGRTPICDECDRLVASGVVVVAAAGNRGYERVLTSGGELEAYRAISITDPGNAESVITVGSTHRYEPHTYGVSYFSSRGPTGDGRIKPDVLGPGERVYSTVPNDAYGAKDGTSMAAPHVSGVAALLMARHREFVGQPVRVKKILCTTATDLGRERYFQGAGMIDALRALQSV